MCNNSIVFNNPDTAIHKVAVRLLRQGTLLIDRAAAGFDVGCDSNDRRIGHDVGFVHYYVQWHRGDDGSLRQGYTQRCRRRSHRRINAWTSLVSRTRAVLMMLARRATLGVSVLSGCDKRFGGLLPTIFLHATHRTVPESPYQPMILQLAQKPSLVGWRNVDTLDRIRGGIRSRESFAIVRTSGSSNQKETTGRPRSRDVRKRSN